MLNIDELRKRSWTSRGKLVHAGASVTEEVWERALKWCQQHKVARSQLVEALLIEFLEEQERGREKDRIADTAGNPD